MVKQLPDLEGKKYFEITRKERIWFCSECKREFQIAPPQCPCGAADKVFLEKDIVIPETKRQNYVVNSNIVFEGSELKKGWVLSMWIKDQVTKGLLKRNLISEFTSLRSDNPKPEIKIEDK